MENTRPHIPTDYDEYAPTYAWARSAVPWVLSPLNSLIGSLGRSSRILEVGCGTGNYIRALAESHCELECAGADLSLPMLRQAASFSTEVALVQADASKALPFASGTIDLMFMVDVVHHLEDTNRFFGEAHRVLGPGGRLVIFTDSEQTLRRRSLTRFFPDILPLELARYPQIGVLREEARRAGLTFLRHEIASGYIPFDEGFVAALRAKCSSAMRLITAEEHRAGLDRVSRAQAEGEEWFSCYDVLEYVREGRVEPRQ